MHTNVIDFPHRHPPTAVSSALDRIRATVAELNQAEAEIRAYWQANAADMAREAGRPAADDLALALEVLADRVAGIAQWADAMALRPRA